MIHYLLYFVVRSVINKGNTNTTSRTTMPGTNDSATAGTALFVSDPTVLPSWDD